MTANMAAAELQAGVNTEAPPTPPPSHHPGYPPGYGFDDQMPSVPGQGGSALPARQADPMAQMVAMLTNIINALPSSIAAAVTASSSHRMANVKLEMKAFERIKTFTNIQPLPMKFLHTYTLRDLPIIQINR